MITIRNISPAETPDAGLNQYELKINRKRICVFQHHRQHNGLAQCLRDAADAVAKEGKKELNIWYGV